MSAPGAHPLRLLGPAREGDDDALDLLLACHERIRRFIGLAARLCEDGADLTERAEAAERVRRYFAEALPRHVADEDASLLPRLRGQDPAIDAALAQMHAEHEAHAPHLARLVALCQALAQDPADAAARAALHPLATQLADDFAAHLALEEQVLFVGLRERLGPAGMAALLAELRARRGQAIG